MSVILYLNLRRTHLEHGAALEAAHRLGFGVALVADAVPAGLPPGIVRTVHQVDTFDLAAVDAAVDAIAAEHDVAGVVTWSDRDVVTVSRIAARLGLPAAPVEAARVARNKYLMRQALADAPHTIPRYALVRTWDEAVTAAEAVGYSAVLKPTSASGSKGIFVLRGPQDLRPAFEDLMRLTAAGGDRVFEDNPNELVLEEYLTGTEHSVEGFVIDGEPVIVGVTDKDTTEPFKLELGHVFPSSLPPDRLTAVHDLTRTVVAAVGLDRCTFHLECKVDDQGRARLVEVAARIGGDLITSHLVGLATGTPFYENVLRVAVGHAPVLPQAQPRVAGLRKIMATQDGTFRGMDGLWEALAVPGVRHVVAERAPGATVRMPPADYMSCTLGAVLAVGDTAEEVRGTLDTAAGLLRPGLD
ncbi:ATP-grasp domain-containing protein [Cellulomonas bogoriensis]|uniref:Dehydrogenase n=1 Tax=Cellulomonas bogoriensis 69B4 = DSM 16987 TaxID=1386082 RepID=A0A0A0BZN4_9CELL|nr:ATP-grasp domain-containing protein [Cellulomonas bogoriensis]KGM13848.1 dehydrogenase [Cellulomonas bogoriensis 69B4 = DSM 16987]